MLAIMKLECNQTTGDRLHKIQRRRYKVDLNFQKCSKISVLSVCLFVLIDLVFSDRVQEWWQIEVKLKISPFVLLCRVNLYLETSEQSQKFKRPFCLIPRS